MFVGRQVFLADGDSHLVERGFGVLPNLVTLLGDELPMLFAALLALPSPPALDGTDKRIQSTFERPATLNAVALGPRVFLAIRGSTLGVQTLPVAVAPILRRLPVTVPTPRRDAEVHPAVARELLERKPFGAPRALLLRNGLNPGVFAPRSRLSVSLAASG